MSYRNGPALIKKPSSVSDSSPRRRFLALLAWEDFVYLVAFWSHVFLWRGCWHFNEELIIQDEEV